MTSLKDSCRFGERMSSVLNFDNLLSEAIEWIQKNLNPEDVFDEEDLKIWAENEGYTKP